MLGLGESKRLCKWIKNWIAGDTVFLTDGRYKLQCSSEVSPTLQVGFRVQGPNTVAIYQG